jgi:hypothetical protein
VAAQHTKQRCSQGAPRAVLKCLHSAHDVHS